MSLVVLLRVFAVILVLRPIGSTVGQDLDCPVNATATPSPSRQTSGFLSRRKRYLAFPSGSAFVATLTLLKAIQVKEPSNWNLDLEFDMIWPIPNQETLHKRRRPLKRVGSFHRIRRHRRELYANIELALTSQGLPGKKCLLRAICETNANLNPPGVSFIDDVLRVILSHDDASTDLDPYDVAYRRTTSCVLDYPCPISLLDLLSTGTSLGSMDLDQ